MFRTKLIASKILYEDYLMDGMNKLTLLRAFAVGIGGKDYETEGQDRYICCTS